MNINARSVSQVCLSKRLSSSQLSIQAATAYFASTRSQAFASPFIAMHPFHNIIALKYMFQTVSLARGPAAISPGKRNAYYNTRKLDENASTNLPTGLTFETLQSAKLTT